MELEKINSSIRLKPIPGIYGFVEIEIKDRKLLICLKNGYVNATKLCKKFKGKETKKTNKWMKLEKTEKLMLDVCGLLNINKDDLMFRPNVSNNNKLGKKISGTYIHPILLTDFMSWVDRSLTLLPSLLLVKFIYENIGNYKETNKEHDVIEDEIDMKQLSINELKYITNNEWVCILFFLLLVDVLIQLSYGLYTEKLHTDINHQHTNKKLNFTILRYYKHYKLLFKPYKNE